MTGIARLTLDHVAQAAHLHRVAGALIPGYDMDRHTPAEHRAFYRDKVMVDDTVWGIFAGDRLSGFIALLPGWIDHLYVDPAHHRTGIGTRLAQFAQQGATELRLYTFQSNRKARAFYEKHGFVIEEMTDGDRNEEKMPDITYRWVRGHGVG